MSLSGYHQSRSVLDVVFRGEDRWPPRTARYGWRAMREYSEAFVASDVAITATGSDAALFGAPRLSRLLNPRHMT
ncbi:hypothetical protein MPLB_1680003 [Mesorhizobium sp. ORS 3324]|nr:hypothetical protein MPLB_1680003 [Mesorhizobium sp. ORS 3324]